MLFSGETAAAVTLYGSFLALGAEKLEDRPVGHEGEQLKLHGEHLSKEYSPGKRPLKGIEIYNYKMSDRELSKESLIRAIKAKSEAWAEIPGLYRENCLEN
jgi:hypothetical protein